MAEALRLRVQDLVVRSDRGRALLTVPALELEPGMSLGVRGPSGAGKSTLLLALAGLIDGVAGRIEWGGRDLAAMPASGRAAFRARHVGMVFQDFLLFEELGPLANAAMPAMLRPKHERAAIRQRAAHLLEQMGIHEDGRAVPTLSGGERQRVGVARALATAPAIVLADEPTANLDRATGDALIDDLVGRTAGTGATLVAVSHDDALLSRMDRVATLRDGTMELARA